MISHNQVKEEQVQAIFNTIASRYDLVNTVISLGRHHFWKKFTVEKAAVPKSGTILDVCCGTGIITMDLAKKVGPGGKVIGLDFSEKMLAIARRRLENFKLRNIIELIEADAAEIPVMDDTFDCATIGYGLRNTVDPKQVLREIKRVVKPGSRVVSLEMAKPSLPLFKQFYYLYLSHWVPFIGAVLVKNRAAYQYFHDSIISFIQPNEVTAIYQELGFEDIQCYQLTLGVVAVHVGTKHK